jgi:hypothetical protein
VTQDSSSACLLLQCIVCQNIGTAAFAVGDMAVMDPIGRLRCCYRQKMWLQPGTIIVEFIQSVPRTMFVGW